MIKLMHFLAPYRSRVVFMLLLLFVQVLGTLYIPTLTADIVNRGIVPGNLDYVWRTGGMMLLVAVLTAGVSVFGTYTSTVISTGMGTDIRSALFRKVQSFSISDFNQFGAASMITRSTSDVTQVQQAFSVMVEMLLPVPFMTLAGLALTFAKSPLLAFVILILMLLVVLATVVFVKKVTPIFEKLQTSMDRINSKVRENIIGVRVIRAFNRHQDEKARADEAFQDYADTAIQANKFFAAMLPLIMAVMNLCTLLILWIGGKQVASGSMQIGDIMAIIEYAMLILMYLIMGIAFFAMIPRAQTCAVRINEVLEKDSWIAEAAVPFSEAKSDVKSDAKVEFRDVSFRYESAEDPVLHKISFTVPKGSTTAIIGGTGSGKSTIASLLMRFYEIQEGHILVDGKDVLEYSQRELRDKIGYVPQKAFLFSGTIADNLHHGKKDAGRQEMIRACRVAQIEDFIAEREKGFDALVSQGGSNFSGGQRQRLSIARAIVKKPEIFIFDDSFSALDFKTDAKLRAALKQEVEDSAVIIVAQRINTIIDADQIVVLDEGRIAGIGSHEKLLKGCELYRQIAQSQLSEEELA